MISESDIQKAVDFLRDSAPQAAEAKAERVWCDEYRKSLKSLLANDCNEDGEARKERFAYSHPKYLEHLDRLRAAVIEDEKLRMQRQGALAKIDSWRTMEANKRGVDRAG